MRIVLSKIADFLHGWDIVLKSLVRFHRVLTGTSQVTASRQLHDLVKNRRAKTT